MVLHGLDRAGKGMAVVNDVPLGRWEVGAIRLCCRLADSTGDQGELDTEGDGHEAGEFHGHITARAIETGAEAGTEAHELFVDEHTCLDGPDDASQD